MNETTLTLRASYGAATLETLVLVDKIDEIAGAWLDRVQGIPTKVDNLQEITREFVVDSLKHNNDLKESKLGVSPVSGSQQSTQRPPTSRKAALGRTDMSRASTHAYAMNCSTAKSSIPLREVQIVIESSRINPLGYKPPALEGSCRHSPRGRPRYVHRLRRPR